MLCDFKRVGAQLSLEALASSKAFCRCLLFQLSVREMLSTQSSFFLSRGSTVGNGKREAEMVT
jgi:hypothetical protein